MTGSQAPVHLAQGGEAEPAADLHFRAEEDRVRRTLHQQSGDRRQAAQTGKSKIRLCSQCPPAIAQAGHPKTQAGEQARGASFHEDFKGD